MGATLGATQMNDLVVLRTDVNSGQRQARGRGLIRTGAYARTGIYGSVRWGSGRRGRDPGARRHGVRSACDSERLTTVTRGQSWSLDNGMRESAQSAFVLVRALETSPE